MPRTPSIDVETVVLDAAAGMLLEGGVDTLTMRSLAEAAGVAPMTLYNRFGGKCGVLEALFRRGFDRLAEGFRDLPEGEGRARLRHACLVYRDLAVADPASYSLMFERRDSGFRPSDDARRHARGAFQVLVGLVREAMAAGEVGSADPVDVAQRLWAACHGAVALELRDLGFVDDRVALYGRLVDTVLAGLAHQPGIDGRKGSR